MIEKLIYPAEVTMTPDYIEDTYVYELFYDSPYDRITPEEAAKYISDITAALNEENEWYAHDGSLTDSRGMMEYFWYEDDYAMMDSITAKTLTAFPSAEVIDGKLYGVMLLEVDRPLIDAEMVAMKSYVSIWMRDEYGLQFKQTPVHTPDGDLFVDFLRDGSSIETEHEFRQRLNHSADVKSTGQLSKELDAQSASGSCVELPEIMSPELPQTQNGYISEKLYYPIYATLYYDNDWDGYGTAILYATDEMTQAEADKYMPNILSAIERNTKRIFSERGLMGCFLTAGDTFGQAFTDKVFSVMPTIEVNNGKLYGVMELRLREQLTPDEWPIFKNTLTNLITTGYQGFDGYVEHEVKTHDGELNLSYWPDDVNYFMVTQSELTHRTPEPEQRLDGGSMQPMEL